MRALAISRSLLIATVFAVRFAAVDGFRHSLKRHTAVVSEAGEEAAHGVSGRQPSDAKDYRVIYGQKVQKETRGLWRGRWLERELRIIHAEDKKWIEFHSSTKGDPLFFNICEDNLKIEQRHDIGVGVFKVRVDGQKYPSFTFRVAHHDGVFADIGAALWVSSVQDIIKTCSPDDLYDDFDDSSHEERFVPGGWKDSRKEVKPLRCHSKNLQNYIDHSWDVLRHGEWASKNVSTEWPASDIQKEVFNVKKALKDAERSVVPLVNRLTELVDMSSDKAPSRFEEADCGDKFWEEIGIGLVTDENAEQVGIDGANRFLQSKLEAAQSELEQEKEAKRKVEDELQMVRRRVEELQELLKQQGPFASFVAPTPGGSQATLPELNQKQKIDLRMIQGGQTTLEAVKAKLAKGIGFPPKKMPEAELEEYVRVLTAHLQGGDTADSPSKPSAASLPELNQKQKIDLRMIQNGDTTLDAVKAKLAKGTGFPPKKMPEAEMQEYIRVLEAHLKGADSATSPAASLPELNQKQKIDLRMIKNGDTTLDAVKAKLEKGTGFPPKKMPQNELDEYVKVLEAHLNAGGATSNGPPTPPPLPPPGGGPPLPPPMGGLGVKTAVKKRTFMDQVAEELVAQELLMKGTPAALRPAGELNASSALAMIEIDRDHYLKKKKGNAEKKKQPTKESKDEKPLYDFSFVDNRAFGWQIQVQGIDKTCEQMSIRDKGEFLNRALSADVAITGKLGGERPDALGRITQFLESVTEEELEVASMDQMMQLKEKQPAEFAKHFSGVTGVSAFLNDIGKLYSKKPKAVIACLADRFVYKETLDESMAQLRFKEEYYNSGHPASLIQVIDKAVSDQIASLLRTMSNASFDQKPAGVQKEYKYIERNLQKTTASQNFKLGWISKDIDRAVVPLLYVMNALNGGKGYTIASYSKRTDDRWAPHYLDAFLKFLADSRGKGDQATYFSQMNQLCTSTSALGDFERMTQATGAQISVVQTAQASIDRCERITSKVAPSTANEWTTLRNTSKNVLQRLEAIEQKVFEAAGAVSANLLPVKNGKPDWALLKTEVRKYATMEMMSEEDSGPDKVFPPVSIFDDYSIRHSLHLFCSRLHEQRPSMGTWFSTDNAPPSIP